MDLAVAHGLDEVLVFEAAGQRFGLPGSLVRELVRAVSISPWPRGPKFALGLINLRGTIVPVLDVRQWLGLPAKPLETTDHFVVVEVDSRLLALRVDRAVDLARLSAGAIDESGQLVAGPEGCARVARLPDGLLLVPDLGQLLAQAAAPHVPEAISLALDSREVAP